MWKRLFVWAISLCISLFALRDGYWILGVGMLSVSVALVFLRILKIFRERTNFGKQIDISHREVACLFAVLSAFILADYFGHFMVWLGYRFDNRWGKSLFVFGQTS